ncbi:MAG: glycosyltransferase family 4 protein [Phormidesmis sp.]
MSLAQELDRELRILHVLNHVRETGNGIVNATVDLACSQAKLGHQVAVASAGGDYVALLEEHGVHHFHLDQQRTVRNLPSMLRNYGRIIETVQPHVVHTHMMMGVLLAWSYRQYSRIQPRQLLNLPKLLTNSSSTQASRPYSVAATVHNEFQRNAILMKLADQLICVSKAVADAMHRRGVPESKLQVVLNGTLKSPRQLPQDLSATVTLSELAIVTVAGMYERKGMSELIEAFARLSADHPQVNLYLVGDGPARQSFEQEAQQTSAAARIHFEGFQSNPLAYMRAADIFVLASHREPCALVLSEARAAGCAIVASQVDGIPEALDGGQAGLFCEPRNALSLETALRQLIESREQRETYQQLAQENLAYFEVGRVAEETLAVYKKMLPASSDDQSHVQSVVFPAAV